MKYEEKNRGHLTPTTTSFWEGGGLGDPYFFLHISSSWVKIRLHTENELLMLSGSALKVELGGVAQDMWWMLRRICGGGGPTNNLVYPNYS